MLLSITLLLMKHAMHLVQWCNAHMPPISCMIRARCTPHCMARNHTHSHTHLGPRSQCQTSQMQSPPATFTPPHTSYVFIALEGTCMCACFSQTCMHTVHIWCNAQTESAQLGQQTDNIPHDMRHTAPQPRPSQPYPKGSRRPCPTKETPTKYITHTCFEYMEGRLEVGCRPHLHDPCNTHKKAAMSATTS